MHTGILATSAVVGLFGATLSPQSPATIENPPADKIVIEVATVNGSGCPKGTAEVAVSPDNTAFTVTYSRYLARVGGTSDPTDYRKNCQLSLVVYVPSGFTYAVASADYRGYASLQPGATSEQKASYYFQGSPDTAARSHPFKGPQDDNWQVTDKTDWGQMVWAPCGARRNFNINTELRVNAGTSDPKKTSFMTMDSTDGDINTVYRLAWKQCPKP
ncbi:DUF4360 domain-containing protein [Streptomyces sp. AC536]|uniref:DUF4360 domain-containing protein n=1 Tax=Streptomyces buecherae TaxID=2763006 RepID=UPI00164D5B7D|nr:DUF4360 domain-containing protein [Streptomyces buecherae]MBC3987191.1 DUF4360 domain-containing protein [Streptomyces buecherae]QNJ43707.1 DUF4360 domain-containing protein [Streptomyces buecherae]